MDKDQTETWEKVYDENLINHPVPPPIKIIFYRKIKVSIKPEKIIPLYDFKKEYRNLISHFYEDE